MDSLVTDLDRKRVLVNEEVAAKIVTVDKRTMQSWRYRKVGPPYIKVGRLVRYSIADIEKFLQDRRVEAV